MDTNKLTVLLDCDGVLSDFVQLSLDFIEEKRGIRYETSDVKEWEIFTGFGLPELWKEFNVRCQTRGVCRGMTFYPESKRPVAIMKEKYDVLVVTSPVDAEPWMYERALWLEDHYGFPRSKVIFANEKQHVVGDVLIDDKPANVNTWAARNPSKLAILWDHSYNQGCFVEKNVVRLGDWDEALSLIETLKR